MPPAFSKAFRDQNIPVVNTFGRYSSSPEVHVVGIGNAEAGRMAARALIERGYMSVAFLGGPEAASSTQGRLKGFREEPSAHPDIQVSHSFAAHYSFQAGRSEMLRLAKAGLAEDISAAMTFCRLARSARSRMRACGCRMILALSGSTIWKCRAGKTLR